MIDITESMARHTVTFDREFTGRELINAIGSICDRYAESYKINPDRSPSHDRYFAQPRYDDRMLVTPGRASENRDRTLVVVADRTTPYLEPDKSYGSVVIAHDEAPLIRNGSTRNVDFQSAVRSVREFGEDLRQQLGADRAEGLDRSLDPALAPAAGAATRPQPGAAMPRTSAATARVPHRATPSAEPRNRNWVD